MSKINNFFITLDSIYLHHYKDNDKEMHDRYSYNTTGDEHGRNANDHYLLQEQTLSLGCGRLIFIIIDKTSDIWGCGSDFSIEEVESEISLPEDYWYPVNHESIFHLY